MALNDETVIKRRGESRAPQLQQNGPCSHAATIPSRSGAQCNALTIALGYISSTHCRDRVRSWQEENSLPFGFGWLLCGSL